MPYPVHQPALSEWEAAGMTTSSLSSATATHTTKWTSAAAKRGEASAASSASIHHIEEHLWVDLDSAAHSTTSKTAHAASSVHFRGINEIFAAVESCTLL